MKVHKSYLEMKKSYPGLVVALGNFDGVHHGHRKLLDKLVTKARELNGIPAVFTFDPHPMQVINPECSPQLLLSKEDKKEMIASLDVEVLFCIPFTPEFGQMNPEEFVRVVLIEQLGIKGLLVGYNYSFGRGGQGTPEMLESFAKEYNFQLDVIPPVLIDDQPVSSTLIRNLMVDGNVDSAAKLLGYRPFLKGEVVTGDQRGRHIGFPTANLDITGEILVPATGVYAVDIIYGENRYNGVANIGYKPTFENQCPVKNLEVHIFDFKDDIYGKDITVEFAKRIRPENKFASVEELINQIEEDKREALSYFRQA